MKARFLIFTGLIAILIVSCAGWCGENARFENIANQYIEDMLKLNPQWATHLGDHQYDHLINDYSIEGVADKLKLFRSAKDSLEQIDPAKLNSTNLIDYKILLNKINYGIFSLDTLRSYEWNPRRYNPGGAIYSLLARDFAPLPERLKSVKSRLEAIPEMLENARKNLKNPPKIHTETAILQLNGTIGLIRDDLNDYLKDAPEMTEVIKPAQDAAVTALEQHLDWLKDDLLPRSDGDFRIGDDKYRVKLNYSLESGISKEDLLKRAEQDLAAVHEEIYKTAIPLFKEYFPNETDEAALSDKKKVVKMVLDHMAEDHPTAETIVDHAKATLTECEDFVREKDLVSLPDKPIDIVIMPEFERGVAVAYCSSPGPLEKGGKTFYAISPPPASWDEKQVESYFREYNNQMIYDLTIHEAMPGHYLQAAHSNKFKASTMVRSIYGSGPFAEGWATYCEQVMVEQGFGGPETKMQMLKMELRAIINAIIDQKIHTAGMTEQEAMDMMLNEGFQEQGEAAGKWRRACLSSVQLSTYFAGNIAVNDIRRDYETKMGDKFNLKEFHDKLLSFGTPAPKYVRELMGL